MDSESADLIVDVLHKACDFHVSTTSVVRIGAQGAPMVEGFRKTFRGGPAQRLPPDLKQWRMVAPKTGSSQPIQLNFLHP